jgi:hypothetical protein
MNPSGDGRQAREILTVDFASKLEERFEQTGNPVFAWLEIKGCRDNGEPVPEWADAYLSGFFGRMFDPGAAGESVDTRAVLPWILGFDSERGRASQLTAPADLERHEKFAVAFVGEILNGASPKAARDHAYNRCDGEGEADDRALRRRLASFFGVEKCPKDNKGWRKVIIKFLFSNLIYALTHPKLPNPFALILENRDLFPELREIRVVDSSGRAVPRLPKT